MNSIMTTTTIIQYIEYLLHIHLQLLHMIFFLFSNQNIKLIFNCNGNLLLIFFYYISK